MRTEDEITHEVVALLEGAETLPVAEKIEALRKAMLVRARWERQSLEDEWAYLGLSREAPKA